jgi:hypothetical protein
VNLGTLNVNATGAVSVTEDDATQLTGVNTANSLALVTTSIITDNANTDIAVTNNASFSGSSITLGDDVADTQTFGSLTFSSAGVVTFTEDNATDIAGTSTAGSLAITSAAAITNPGVVSVTVTNNASFSGTSISLGFVMGDSFSFGSLTFNTTGASNIAADSAVQLTGTSGAGSANIGSTGAITNAASASVAVTNLFTVSGTSINLGNQAGDSMNFGTLNFLTSPGLVLITEDSSMNLASTSTATAVALATTSASDGIFSGTAGTDITGTSISLSAGSAGIGGSGNPVVVDGTTSLATSTSGNGNQFLSEANSVNWNTSGAGAGTITLLGGTFNVGSGQSITAGTLTVTSPAVLGGTGTISGNVNGTGMFSPGISPGQQTINGNFTPGGPLVFEVNAPAVTPGTDYDQYVVNGSVNVGGATLSTSGTVTSVPGQQIVLIANDGTDAVVGMFATFAEGATVNINGVNFILSYAGGAGGNDVTLTQAGAASYSANNAAADTWIIRKVATNIQILNGGMILDSRPEAAITSIAINGEDNQNDSLLVDFNGGMFAIPITYTGGTAADDALGIRGTGTQTTSYTPNATTMGNGQVTVDGTTINFTGLEPVDFDNVGTFTLNLPGAADVVTLTNGFNSMITGAAEAAGTVPAMVFTGTSGGVGFEAAHVFRTTNVTVNTAAISDGSDTITIASANNAHANTNLSFIVGAVGTDTLTVNGAATVSGTFSATGLGQVGDMANLNANITAATITGDAVLVNVDNNPTGQIQDGVDLAASGGTVDVAAGTFTELVTVGKTLTLLGNQAGVDARTRAVPVAQETVVNSSGGSFSFTANSIVLDGFTVEGTTVAAPLGSGIATSALFSGYQIRNNIIRDNIIGLILHTPTAGALATVVERNRIADNDNTGPATGTGLYSQDGLSNTTIQQNLFTGTNDTFGLNVFAAGAAIPNGVTVNGNQFEGGNAARFGNVDNSSFTNNQLSGALVAPRSGFQVTGISVSLGSDSIIVDGNTFTNRLAGAISVSGGNSNVTVSNNIISRM